MEAIQDINKETFEYLTGISKKLWTGHLLHIQSGVMTLQISLNQLMDFSPYGCYIFYFNADCF
jgi:hypothetical protein